MTSAFGKGLPRGGQSPRCVTRRKLPLTMWSTVLARLFHWNQRIKAEPLWIYWESVESGLPPDSLLVTLESSPGNPALEASPALADQSLLIPSTPRGLDQHPSLRGSLPPGPLLPQGSCRTSPKLPASTKRVQPGPRGTPPAQYLNSNEHQQPSLRCSLGPMKPVAGMQS